MLYNSDCTIKIKELPDNYYDLIILDPPYGKCTKAAWDKNTFKLDDDFLNNLFRVLSPNGSLYIHCGMGEKSNSLIDWFNVLSASKFHFKETITWKKTRGMGMRKGYLQTSEFILWYVKDNKNFRWNIENQYTNQKRAFDVVKAGGIKVNKSDFKRINTVWDIPEIGFGSSPRGFRQIKSKISHLTPKHPKLSNIMIKSHCNENSKVLIPFAGSGMEILSCVYNNIEYDAIEIDTNNIDFITNSTLKYEQFV